MAKKTPNTDQQTFDSLGSVPTMPPSFYSGDKPNPHLHQFVEEHAAPYDATKDDYNTPAFTKAIDTTKATSLFNLHSYFSKKPHDAIRQYIRHYTSPGDIVLDPFCGSGGTVISALLENRKAIAIDRSPAATFIAKSYCKPLDSKKVVTDFADLTRKSKKEMDWLYGSKCDRCGGDAWVAHTVYSQVFQCPRCLIKIPLFDCVEVEIRTGTGKKKLANACPACHAKGHTEIIRSQSEKYGYIPVQTAYVCLCGCKPARGERQHLDADRRKRQFFEEYDLGKIKEIEGREIPYWYPKGYDMTSFSRYQRDALYYYGVKEVADLFTKRNLWALALLRHHSSEPLRFTLSAIVLNASRMYRHREAGGGGPKGTDFMIPQTGREMNVWSQFEGKVKELLECDIGIEQTAVCISTQNAYDLGQISSNKVDYVFTDPPYGGTIQYGELSIVWEAWQGFDQNWRADEVTIAAVRNKTEVDWENLMRRSMAECYRVLKPGHWLSLCYHDTSEGTWELIQDIMAEVGFVVDRTETALFIDTGQKTYNQLTADKSTKRDLVLNFRKPKPLPFKVTRIYGPEDAEKLPKGSEIATFTDFARQIIRDFLTRRPGATKDRIYDELVSRLVASRSMEAHDFDAMLQSVAEQVQQQGQQARWYLKETADQVDQAEKAKEDAASARLEKYVIKYLREKPELEGVHYSDLFEQFLPVTDKPRRLLADWLPEYFIKSPSGTWRPPDDDERKLLATLREAGTLRRIKRFANALIEGVPVRDKDHPGSDQDLLDWLRQCRRAGLYDQGKAIYDKGGLNLANLSEEDQIDAEDNYRICVRRGSNEEAKPKRQRRKKKNDDDE